MAILVKVLQTATTVAVVAALAQHMSSSGIAEMMLDLVRMLIP